jgi:membrane protein YqaA with SNARE-associated domain
MEWLLQLGYFGLFLGTLAAGSVLPFSSDVLMIGILAAGGNAWICLVLATLGNWLGSYTSYWLGRLGKWDKLEKWFKVKREQLEKQKKIIDKYGLWLAFFSWLPLIGVVSVIALGFYRVQPKIVATLILTGCFTRFLFWVILHKLYGQQFIDWITG